MVERVDQCSCSPKKAAVLEGMGWRDRLWQLREGVPRSMCFVLVLCKADTSHVGCLK